MSEPKWEDCYEKFSEVVGVKKTGVVLTASLKLVVGDTIFHAVRHQSSYGWASYEVYQNGVLISQKYGSNLPLAATLVRRVGG